jgi:hypothetical protein
LNCGSSCSNTNPDNNSNYYAAYAKEDDDEHNEEASGHLAYVLSILVFEVISTEATDALLCIGAYAAPRDAACA